MDAAPKQFLEDLLSTPSPSGYEQPVQQVVRDYAKSFADDIRTDLHGNVICARNPGAKRRLMLSGHCDQIGLIVEYIDPDGFIFVQPIGGWDVIVLPGQRMVVRTEAGPVQAVVGRKPIHLLSEEERKSIPKMEDLWLDIGVRTQEEAAKLVRIGDSVTLELEMRYLPNGRFVSPGLDDKVGVWVVMEALRRVDGRRLSGGGGKGARRSSTGESGWGVFSVSSVQEELGLRGAKT
ncbi:MAG: M42 family peptidase, partial [Planctomycetia bacterium]|nr:M42 family peptidase [Planctomycetia bacterium]